METWKDIVGYEGWYQVSDMGNVRSLTRTFVDIMGRTRTHKGRVLKLSENSDGYKSQNLLKFGESKGFKVHRLVAMAFIPNPENKPEVNHKDGVKSNNIKDNLEWATHIENMRHAISYGLNDLSHLKRASIAGAKKSSKLVLDQSTGIFYESCSEASKMFNTTYTKLRCKLNGKTKNNTNLIYV